MNEIITISGLRCELSTDEHGFFDISIEHEIQTGEALFDVRNDGEHPIPYMEWIVRGMVDRQKAVDLAERVIAAKRDGLFVWHDAEGVIHAGRVRPE